LNKLIALVVLMLATSTLAVGQVETTNGIPIYGVAHNGELKWYFHRGAGNGAALWATQGNGSSVGTGWTDGINVFKGDPHGDDGVIYRVDSLGDLYWYKHRGYRSGSSSWIQGKKVGDGWNSALQAFGAGNGVIYIVQQNGDLYWYRHLGYQNGSYEWANGAAGKKVGSGWGGARVFAGGNGVLYRIDAKGDLFWYRHTGYADGSYAWADPLGAKVGSGWNGVPVAFSGGDGVIYALKNDNNLYWYNHAGYQTGAVTWTSGTGNRIGTGWGSFVRIF
jgi:hypothetical protein